MGNGISEFELDKMLSDYFGHVSQESFVFERRQKTSVKTIIVCAAALLAVIVVLFAALCFRPSNNEAPEKKIYAFSAEKLAAFCRDESVQKKTADKNVGAWEPYIEYADSEKVVFSVATGVFVFDYCDGEFLNTFDLGKIGVPPFAQGDTFSSLSVSRDGDCGLLYSRTTGEAPGYAVTEEYRKLDLASGTVEVLDSGKEFYEEHEIFRVSPVGSSELELFPQFVLGESMATAKENEYLIALDYESGAGRLGSLRLIILNSDTGEIKSMVSVFENEVKKKIL